MCLPVLLYTIHIPFHFKYLSLTLILLLLLNNPSFTPLSSNPAFSLQYSPLFAPKIYFPLLLNSVSGNCLQAFSGHSKRHQHILNFPLQSFFFTKFSWIWIKSEFTTLSIGWSFSWSPRSTERNEKDQQKYWGTQLGLSIAELSALCMFKTISSFRIILAKYFFSFNLMYLQRKYFKKNKNRITIQTSSKNLKAPKMFSYLIQSLRHFFT